MRQAQVSTTLFASCAAALVVAGAMGTVQEPHQIVVLGGAITEILYDLKVQGRIAGVDTTSKVPAEALRTKPNVGYVRALSAEGVLSLKPDLILAVPYAGPTDAIGIIKGTGVPFTTVPEEATPEGVLAKIAAVGKAVGRADAAKVLAEEVARGFEALKPLRARITKPKRVLFLLSLQNGRSVAAGHDTAADGIIKLAGAANALADVKGFRPISDESITAAQPDAILVMQNAGPPMKADDVFARQAFASTPAGKTKTLIQIDGLLLLGFGPRTPEAVRTLIEALYPELKAKP